MQPTTKAAVLNSLLSPDTCEVMNPSPRRNTGSQSLLLDLSDELIGVVISNIQLSLEDVMRASRVCSRLYRLTHEDAVWHRLYDAHFNGKTAERTASAKPVTPDNAATAASDGKQKAGSGLGSGASSTSNGPAASVSSAVGTSTPPPASGTWHERFKQRFVAEAKEQRFQRRVARLKATSCLHTVQAELSRLRQALEDEHTKLAVTLSELTRLRKVMAAEAAQVSGWTPAAVQHHYSRVVEQQPVSAAWRVCALEQEAAVSRKALACIKTSLAARRREHAEAVRKLAMLQA